MTRALGLLVTLALLAACAAPRANGAPAGAVATGPSASLATAAPATTATPGATAASDTGDDPMRKVQFDLSQINEDGLRGPPDGLVSVTYEFCIPATEECKAQVRSIDPAAGFQCGSRGRVGCTPDECLCLGSTHQRDFRATLQSLAELPYVDEIRECFFE